MEHNNKSSGRRNEPHARTPGLAALRAGLVTALATLSGTCAAADSISGLGSAFRPQAGVNASTAGGGERGGANLPGLRVIVSSKARSVAVIDGQVVHMGDIVNGMRVTQISEQGVVLSGEGHVQERLAVNPSVIKHTHPVTGKRVANGVRQ